jgi:hypothetical protein
VHAGKIDFGYAKTGNRFRAKPQRTETAGRFTTAKRCRISHACPKQIHKLLRLNEDGMNFRTACGRYADK